MEAWLRRIAAAIEARKAALAALSPPPPPSHSTKLAETGRHLEGAAYVTVCGGV